MTAHSEANGHPISYIGGHWVYDDSRHSVRVDRPRPCRECGFARAVLELTVPAHLSHTGKARLKWVGVDACIAGIVLALNEGGVATIASCCGHGRRPGSIILGDGRELFVASSYEMARKLDKCWPPINEEVNDEEPQAEGQEKEGQEEGRGEKERGGHRVPPRSPPSIHTES